MTQELVDYSRTANADWNALAQSLKAAGKVGVGRYATNDKAPDGRGISAAEYSAMTAAGLDTFVYWESSEGWMTGGYQAGVYAAQNAALNLRVAGMPATTPVYFACDFDAAPEDQAAIDDCLRGAASILSPFRVGIYAGYHVVKRCMANGTAMWFAQTSAWSGGMLLEGVHLYQYDYNEYFNGTNCDLVRAYRANYGQAVPPVVPVEPPPPIPTVPWSKATTGFVKLGNTTALAFLGHGTARRDVPVYDHIGKGKHKIGTVALGHVATLRGTFRSGNARYALVDLGDKGVGRASLAGFAERWLVP